MSVVSMSSQLARLNCSPLSLIAFAATGAAAQTPGSPSAGADWPSFNGSPCGTCYSPLNEITTSNVSRLRPVACFDTGVINSFQTGPVANGVMYLTTYHY